MTEAQLQAAVVECARLLQWRVFHPYDSRRSAAGWPDLFMVREGRAVAAELKTAAGKVSDAQATWLRDLHRAGVEVYVWRPAQWLDGTVEATLKAGHLGGCPAGKEAA